MKKYLICLLAVGLGIALSAYTTPKKVKKAKAGTYYWWDFQGGLLDQWNPDYYYIDGNQMPDCYYMLGLINCEIRALSQEYDPEHPDLTTIVAVRYRPLL